MSAGINTTVLNSWLDGLCRNQAWTQPAAFWVQLHTADPGPSGTATLFGSEPRKQATFSAAGSGAITTSADLAWTSLAQSGTIAWVSFWSASAAGTHLGNDSLETSRAVSAGDNFTIATGDLDLAITPTA